MPNEKERVVLAELQRLWATIEQHSKLELQLMFAALNLSAAVTKAACDAVTTIENGKMPGFDIEPAKRKLLKAACDFAKDGTYKPKAKAKRKKA